jgi:hypothetical protein
MAATAGCPEGQQLVAGSCQTICPQGQALVHNECVNFDISKIKGLRFETVPALINFYMRGTLAIIGIWALLFFIYAGILWLTSGGSPDKIKKAQQIMVWATIGIIVIFASYAIVSQVITAVGG